MSQSITCSSDGSDNYQYPSIDTENECPYNGEACLYDLSVDPCEWNDIKDDEPEIYSKLYEMLVEASNAAVRPLKLDHPGRMDKACPLCHGGFWTPWINTTSYTAADGTTFDFMVEDASSVVKPKKMKSVHLMRRYLHSFLPAF